MGGTVAKTNSDFQMVESQNSPVIPNSYDLDTAAGVKALEKYLIYATSMAKHLDWSHSRVCPGIDWTTRPPQDAFTVWRHSDLYNRVNEILKNLLKLKKEFNATYYRPPEEDREFVDPRASQYFENADYKDYVSDEYYITENTGITNITENTGIINITENFGLSRLDYNKSRWYYNEGKFLNASHEALNHYNFRIFAILDKHSEPMWGDINDDPHPSARLERHDGKPITQLTMEEFISMQEPENDDQ